MRRSRTLSTMSNNNLSPLRRPPWLGEERRESSRSTLEPDESASAYGASPGNGHIQMEEPVRPQLPKRNTSRNQSTRSISEALRLARSREEQETLLGEEEQADDDGCFPPRQNSDPRAPNPHSALPVYTTIHKIRRLIIASIGRVV